MRERRTRKPPRRRLSTCPVTCSTTLSGQRKRKQAQAEQLSAQALTSNRNSDSYTALTILFATVLFSAAVSNLMKKSMNSWTLIGVALVVFVSSATVLASLPKLFRRG